MDFHALRNPHLRSPFLVTIWLTSPNSSCRIDAVQQLALPFTSQLSAVSPRAASWKRPRGVKAEQQCAALGFRQQHSSVVEKISKSYIQLNFNQGHFLYKKNVLTFVKNLKIKKKKFKTFFKN